jgi:uncharacterized membrane protein YkoI
MTHVRCLIALSLLFASAAAAAAGATTSAPRCFADWSDAAPIVGREALVPIKTVHEQARLRRIGDLVRVTLCEEDAGRFVYRLVLREPEGRVVNMTVDARQPFQR